ncbi:MAG: flagellar protein export ATPase FliI [Clostridia bacterium]|jgi:flagellum-specific ATP synthase
MSSSFPSLAKYRKALKRIDPIVYTGRVSQVIGLMVESSGPAVQMGEICHIYPLKGEGYIHGEVVGFRSEKVLIMPFGDLGGVGPGSPVVSTGHPLLVPVSEAMVGRVLDGLGNPIDGKGPIPASQYYQIQNPPPDPLSRPRIKSPLPLGVKAIDGLLTCGRGQRIGIFAGSGVGKSTLLGMIARNVKADINVIALVGERGREVREFMEKDLQEAGMKRSVLVVATSDQPALVRLKCAMTATTIAEYFRDQGYDVMLLMDSLTRFAMAQREIGLAVGEPPVSRGYTPSIFALLPKLLERSGNSEKGSITGIYTVLVDGDDMNEPISDAVRGILDGHIVLSRSIAAQNHYPAIDVLQSISRVMPDITDERHMELANEMKHLLAVYRSSQDLINIGAYRKGSNPEIDKAIAHIDEINLFLRQQMGEAFSFEETVQMLEQVLG